MNYQDEIKKLKKENEELKKELERLKKVEEEYEEHKHHCTIFDKPSFVKVDIKKRHKTPGQKLGHKGYSRHIPERVDFVKTRILVKYKKLEKDLLKTFLSQQIQ